MSAALHTPVAGLCVLACAAVVEAQFEQFPSSVQEMSPPPLLGFFPYCHEFQMVLSEEGSRSNL